MKQLVISIVILTSMFFGETTFATGYYDVPNISSVHTTSRRGYTGALTYLNGWDDYYESSDNESQDSTVNVIRERKREIEDLGFEIESYADNDPWVKLIRYKGTEEVVNIPYEVVEIGDRAFEDCTSVRTVILPENSLYRIGDYAFKNCTELENINIPYDVECMGKCTFMNCQSLKNIDFSNQLIEIPEGMFIGCTSLYNIVLNDGLETIGNYAFAGCTDLTFIELPSSVNKIGNGAFSNCLNLEFVQFNGDFRVNDPVFSCYGEIGNLAFHNCENLREINFSENIVYQHDSFPCGCIVNGKEVPELSQNQQLLRYKADLARKNVLQILNENYNLSYLQDWNCNCSGDTLAALLNTYDHYSALPRVVDEETFIELSEGKPILYRGIGTVREKTGAELADEFRHGAFFNGRGIHGNRTYTTTDFSTAYMYAYECDDIKLSHYGEEGVLKMILDDTSQIIEIDSLQELYRFYKTDDINYLMLMYENTDNPCIVLMDCDKGNLAELAGYDAIHDTCYGEDFYIILNRGKVIVLDKNVDAT